MFLYLLACEQALPPSPPPPPLPLRELPRRLGSIDAWKILLFQ